MLENVEKGNTHTIWLRDFNRHHPCWDDPSNTRLFTNEALLTTEMLISTVVETGLELVLPGGTPTHCHNVTKRWTRLDQVFISEHSVNMVNVYDTLIDHRGINMDHLPIITELDLAVTIHEMKPFSNFRDVTLLGYFSFPLPFIPILLLYLSHACVAPRPLGLASSFLIAPVPLFAWH